MAFTSAREVSTWKIEKQISGGLMWLCSLKYCTPWLRLFLPCLTGGRAAKPRKTGLKLRHAWLISALILLSSGCVSSTTRPIPAEAIPVRPELSSLTGTPDGGIMMDKRDAAELLIYIELLERTVKSVR
jgi:hypothetical protein